MKKSTKCFVALILTVFVSGLLFSCKKEQKPSGESMVIDRISSPDEPLNALAKLIPPKEWKKFQDKNIDVSADKNYNICLTIGARSANALLSVFLNDNAKAEKLADAIKKAAEKLNIKAQTVEVAAKNLNSDITGPEAQDKDQRIRLSLNKLKDEIVDTIKVMGNSDYALLIEYGAWIESIRQGSAIIGSKYNARTSNMLYRVEEAKYFANSLADLNKKKEDALFGEIIKASEEIKKLMKLEKDMSIKKESVAKINQIASEFCSKNIK